MQTMPPSASDTHDHGPPNTPPPTVVGSATIETMARSGSTPFPRLAVWSTKLSSTEVNSFSGAMAGVASGIVTCPLDVIKTKLQNQTSYRNPAAYRSVPQYRGLIGTGKTIIRQDGLKGMYRGLGPMLLGYLPTWAVYMAVYDSGKEYFFTHEFMFSTKYELVARGYASVLAGACSTVVTNPIWVIKTRLMSQVSRSASDGTRTPYQYNNTLDAFRKMYRAEGIRAFYSGLAPALLGLTHVAIQFPLYELFRERFTGRSMGSLPSASSDASDHATNTFGILAATFLSKVIATSATYPHEVLRTRLQTQQRHVHPEAAHDGVSGSHHSQSLTARRIGNTDGGLYRPKYAGMWSSIKLIWREEGLAAFYNGMGTNMVRAVPAAMTTMLTFEWLKGLISKMQEEGRTILNENS